MLYYLLPMIHRPSCILHAVATGSKERERGGPVNDVRSITGMCKHHDSKILQPKGENHKLLAGSHSFFLSFFLLSLYPS